jgi:diguanylate cyclase (GGDEF)-like protein
VSRPPRRQRSPELLRGRFRTLFFIALAGLCMVSSHRLSVLPALAGVLAGLQSAKTARARGRSMGHTYTVCDWLLLGVTLTVAGNAWLVLMIPVLVTGQLSVSPRADWPFLLAPTLLLLIVAAIADPTLGGDRTAGLVKFFVLVAGGAVAAHELKRPHRRRGKVATVDPCTGFYTQGRLHAMLAANMRTASMKHDPLSVVCLRLDHFKDTQAFLGTQGSEALVSAVARRVKRHMQPDDTAFRVCADTFVVALPGRTLREARQEAAAICHDVAAGLIDRQRQTLTAGTASFPTVRSLQELLREASEGLRSAQAPLSAVASQ